MNSTITSDITVMKATRSNDKLLNCFSTNFKKNKFYSIFLLLIIQYFIESTPNSNAYGFSSETKFWKNRTQLLEARKLFSKFDGTNFDEVDYIDSYDTWVKYGASSTGYSSVISKLREMNEHFNKNETSGITKEQNEDVSSFLELVNEYEDIKNELQTKMDSIESESDFMYNHPLIPNKESDNVAQNMADTDNPIPINTEVNITQWVPYSVPGCGNKTQWIPYVVPYSSQSWNGGPLFDNTDPLNEYTNKSVKLYSTKLKEYLLSFGKNITKKSYNSNYR